MEIERGPNWLLVKLRGSAENTSGTEPPLADRLWSVLQQHLVSRLVLELDQIGILDDGTIQALVELHQRISSNGGVMRLSGLSSPNERRLRSSGLDGRLPSYRNRRDAVFGSYRPGQPR